MTLSLSPFVLSFVTFFSFSVFGGCSAFGMSTGLFKVSKECFSSVLRLCEGSSRVSIFSYKYSNCFKNISRTFWTKIFLKPNYFGTRSFLTDYFKPDFLDQHFLAAMSSSRSDVVTQFVRP